MPKEPAAIVLLFSIIGLTGCVINVDRSDQAAGWAYRQGSALELVIRTAEPHLLADGGPPVVGAWTGNGTFAEPPAYSQRYYALEVRNDATGGRTRRTEVRSLDNIDGLPPPENQYDERQVSLRLRRDAGVIILEGVKTGTQGSGDVRLDKDADYAALVAAIAGRDPDAAELTSLALADVKRADVEDVRAAGLSMTPADLIRMRDSGVSGKFLRGLNQGDARFGLDDAIKLHNSGVAADFPKNLHDAGLSASVDDMIRLRDNGVSSGFVRDLAGARGSLPAIDEIIRLRNSGVSARYIAELRAAGYNFSTPDYVRLSQNSVSSAYAKGMKDAGYDLSVDQILRLRNSGVSSQYVKDLQEPGFEKMSLDQIIEAQRKGLSADFVRSLRKHQ
jgi:hypothetical protein